MFLFASSCTYGVPKYGSTSLCDQNDDLESADTHTGTQSHSTRKDRQKVKTDGPMILSNDIFYFKTVMIIGGPKNLRCATGVGLAAVVVVRFIASVSMVMFVGVVVVVLTTTAVPLNNMTRINMSLTDIFLCGVFLKRHNNMAEVNFQVICDTSFNLMFVL